MRIRKMAGMTLICTLNPELCGLEHFTKDSDQHCKETYDLPNYSDTNRNYLGSV